MTIRNSVMTIMAEVQNIFIDKYISMSKQDQTSSFLLRFTQKIFEDEKGEADIQWRGKITHVQGNEQKNFSELKDAIAFIQEKLSKLTLSSIEEDASPEEKEGILVKSMDIWKKLAKSYPKMVVQAIKDPKAQVAQFQEQITTKAEEISNRLDLESYKPTSKSDLTALTDQVSQLTALIMTLQKKVNKIDKKMGKS